MIKTIQMTPNDKLTDIYGDEYPNATVIINNVSETTLKSMAANLKANIYDKDHEITALAYSVNFWSKPQLRQVGKPSRALQMADGNAVFEIDFEQYKEIYDAFNGDHEDAILHVIERHFRNVILPELSK